MEAYKKIKQDIDEKTYFGYTNESNPFNDNQLTKAFVWRENKKNLKINQIEMEREIDIVRKRRQEREKEKERLQEMKLKEFQNKDQDNYEDWLKKEQEFHDIQDKKRAILRIEQERYQPVDYMIQTIMVYKSKLKQPNDIQYMKNPELIIKSLSNEELQICLRESEMQLEEEDINKYGYTSQIQLETSQSLDNQMKMTLKYVYFYKIENMIKDKSVDQLNQLEKQISSTYENKDFKMDVEYWEKILQKIKYTRAKQFLSQFYQDFDSIQDKQIIVNKSTNIDQGFEIDYSEYFQNHNYGDLSPLLLQFSDEVQTVTQEQCNQHLDEQRISIYSDEMNDIFNKIKDKLLAEGKITQSQINENNEIDIEAIKYIDDFQKSNPIQEDEAQFDDHIDLNEQYSWIDKYKPRKPHYFNRVKLGFEWNKYNQTHYDLDNPPPKVIQGYKFNIFYPDLVDKNSTPSYSLHECENENFCMVKFSAGPPYEDIAFKVLKQEWEFNDRHGFKCIFQKGILHLYVNFKKYRYKR